MEALAGEVERMSPADLHLVPKTEGKRKRPPLRLRHPRGWTIWDFLLAGMSGVWAYWVTYSDWVVSGVVGVGIFLLLIVKTEGPKGGPKG